MTTVFRSDHAITPLAIRFPDLTTTANAQSPKSVFNVAAMDASDTWLSVTENLGDHVMQLLAYEGKKIKLFDVEVTIRLAPAGDLCMLHQTVGLSTCASLLIFRASSA